MEQLEGQLIDTAVASALVRAQPDAAVVILDHELRVAYAAGEPLGRISWKAEQIVGLRLADVLPRVIYRQLASSALAALDGERAEVLVASPRSGRRHSIVVEPLRSEEDEVVAVLALLRDPDPVGSPGHAADARFDLLFDSSPIGIALLSPGGRCVRANAALCELLGHSEPELLARSFEDVIHPDEAPETRARTQELFTGERDAYGGERRLRHAGGGNVHVVVRVTLAREASGRPRHLVVQVQDASERTRFEYRLQELTERDGLTGLPNRPQFERELARRAADWQGGGAPSALLLLDLDHFKYVNDAHGHRVGDELLRRIAARARVVLPRDAVVGRLGGDELGALLPAAGAAAAEAAARSLVAAVRTERLAVGDEVLGATASVGVAQLAAATPDAEAVLVAADLAMYEAKASGGDGVALHDPAGRGRERVSADLRWSQRIRAALEEDRFELHAQPVVDAVTGIPAKYEVLIRLRDECGALVAPGAFLPHAERFGLIGDIDRWVVARTVALAARLDVTLALNLSGRSVGDPALLGYVEETIASAGLDPRRLVFEVTETAAIASMGDAQRLAAGLRALGCGFTLDDFGAGFASFTYVKQLPFDFLKIDGSFVRDLPTSAADRLVVRALVQVARGLGKRTVAEFVCSPAVLAQARECGVDLVQGHHAGAPAPLETWLGLPPGAAGTTRALRA